jgi:hypothetical protein
MYKDNLKCPLQCNIELPQEYIPNHILLCPKLSIGSPLQINQFYEADDQNDPAATTTR